MASAQQHARRAGHAQPETRAGGGEDQPADPVGCLVGELLGEDAAEGDAEDVDRSVAERVEHPLRSVRATPGIRRGQGYARGSPTPGASKLMVWMPRASSSRSNGAASSRLAPRPVMISSGRPAPRTEVRSRTPSTSEPDSAPRWIQAKAPTPVMSRPTMSVWMVSVPS